MRIAWPVAEDLDEATLIARLFPREAPVSMRPLPVVVFTGTAGDARGHRILTDHNRGEPFSEGFRQSVSTVAS